MNSARWRGVLAGVVIAALVGCGGGVSSDETIEGLPRVDLIDPAVAAVEDAIGRAPELLEVAATLDVVDVIVRTDVTDDGDAALFRFRSDGELEGPIEPRVDSRATFAPDQIDVDPDRLFDQLGEELPDSAVIDFAMYVDGGVLVYDATVASSNGGVMFVLLNGDGEIGGLQAG